MTQARTSRTLAVTGVIAASLCAPPAVGHTVAPSSCDWLRDGHDFIDWARARSSSQAPHDGQIRSARPIRRAQPLHSLIRITDLDGN